MSGHPTSPNTTYQELTGRQIALNGALGRVRKVVVNGREFWVAPMTLIVPGVLAGSMGPLYYPPEEIARDHQAWNGMPLVRLHPTRNGSPVSGRQPDVMGTEEMGRVYNARIGSGGRLQAEAWFDVEATRRVDPSILERLAKGDPIELSTGLFTVNHPERGVHNGRPYVAVARDYRPDHLAVLPDRTGACSLRDGCGILINESPTGVNGMPATDGASLLATGLITLAANDLVDLTPVGGHVPTGDPYLDAVLNCMNPTSDRDTGRGMSTTYSTSTYQITDKGRAALQQPTGNEADMNDADLLDAVTNAFCPTGKGGGIKTDCSPKGGAAKGPTVAPARKISGQVTTGRGPSGSSGRAKVGAAFTSKGAGTRSAGVASKASAAPAKTAPAAKKPARQVKVTRAEMKAAKKLDAVRRKALAKGDQETAAKATAKLKRIVEKADKRAAGKTAAKPDAKKAAMEAAKAKRRARQEATAKNLYGTDRKGLLAERKEMRKAQQEERAARKGGDKKADDKKAAMEAAKAKRRERQEGTAKLYGTDRKGLLAERKDMRKAQQQERAERKGQKTAEKAQAKTEAKAASEAGRKGGRKEGMTAAKQKALDKAYKVNREAGGLGEKASKARRVAERISAKARAGRPKPMTKEQARAERKERVLKQRADSQARRAERKAAEAKANPTQKAAQETGKAASGVNKEVRTLAREIRSQGRESKAAAKYVKAAAQAIARGDQKTVAKVVEKMRKLKEKAEKRTSARNEETPEQFHEFVANELTFVAAVERVKTLAEDAFDLLDYHLVGNVLFTAPGRLAYELHKLVQVANEAQMTVNHAQGRAEWEWLLGPVVNRGGCPVEYDGRAVASSDSVEWESLVARAGQVLERRLARNAKKRKTQPSDELKKDGMTPEKACKIMEDGKTNGHWLTKDQKGMFGALCGERKDKSMARNAKKGGRDSQFAACIAACNKARGDDMPAPEESGSVGGDRIAVKNDYQTAVGNIFCPTGKGGGRDPSCGKGGKGGKKSSGGKGGSITGSGQKGKTAEMKQQAQMAAEAASKAASKMYAARAKGDKTEEAKHKADHQKAAAEAAKLYRQLSVQRGKFASHYSELASTYTIQAGSVRNDHDAVVPLFTNSGCGCGAVANSGLTTNCGNDGMCGPCAAKKAAAGKAMEVRVQNARRCSYCGTTVTDKDAVCPKCGMVMGMAGDGPKTNPAEPHKLMENANPAQARGYGGRWENNDKAAIYHAVRRAFGGHDPAPIPAMSDAPGQAAPTSDPAQDAEAEGAHSVSNMLARVYNSLKKRMGMAADDEKHKAGAGCGY